MTTHQAGRTASAACGAMWWLDTASLLVDPCWLGVVLPELLIHIVIVYIVAYPDELLQQAMP